MATTAAWLALASKRLHLNDSGSPVALAVLHMRRRSGEAKFPAAAMGFVAATTMEKGHPLTKLPAALPQTPASAAVPTLLPPVVAGETAEVELSGGCPAQADVRGNLGPASVVTKVVPGGNWLKDRWQAARDMSGTPLSGEHWLEVDLKKARRQLTRIVLDFETAHAKDYVLETSSTHGGPWHVLARVLESRAAEGAYTLNVRKRHQHVVHTLEGRSSWHASRFVRARFQKPASWWGISVWRFRMFGRGAPSCRSGPATRH